MVPEFHIGRLCPRTAAVLALVTPRTVVLWEQAVARAAPWDSLGPERLDYSSKESHLLLGRESDPQIGRLVYIHESTIANGEHDWRERSGP